MAAVRRSTRTGVLVAACALVLGAWRAVPVHALGFAPVAAAYGDQIVSDGARHVAVFAGPQLLRIVDADRGNAGRDVPLPTACDNPGSAPVLLGMRAGRVLMFCRTIPGPDQAAVEQPFLLDLATGAWRDVPGYDALVAAMPFAFPTSLGSHWIGAHVNQGPPVWLDLETGRRRTDLGTQQDAVDLDSPALLRPLCSPLRRELPLSADDPAGFEPYVYAPPYGVLYSPSLSTVAIQRCGDPRPTVLARSGGFAFVPGALDGGVLTYGGPALAGDNPYGRSVRAFLPACRTSLAWAPTGLQAFAHAGRSLYVLTHRPEHSDGRLLALRLPRGCPPGDELSVVQRGHGATARASSGRWWAPELAGALVEVLPGPGHALAAPRVRPGHAVQLRTDAVARAVSWRVGGSWQAARRVGRSGRRWTFTVPAVRRAAAISVAVRVAAGGAARFRLRVR